MQLSSEKSVSSFKTLDAIPRVLKIACVQAQESKRAESESPHVDSIQIEMATSFDQEMLSSAKAVQCWKTSMATCVEIFTRYFSLIDDAKRLILHSSACVDRLFDLFWEEGLRGHILSYILDLMKVTAFDPSPLYV